MAGTPTGWNRLKAKLAGQVPAAELDAYRRAGGPVFDLMDQVERRRLECRIDGLDPWTVPPATRIAFLCAWNAFVLQTLANDLVDADYALDPQTQGHLPPVTAAQALSFYGDVGAWVSRAAQAQANPDYRLDVAVPAPLPAWLRIKPISPAHLHGLLHAMRSVHEHADAAMAFLPATPPEDAEKQAQLHRIRQLHAAAQVHARYAEELGAPTTRSAPDRAGVVTRAAIDQFYLLGQLVADPALARHLPVVEPPPTASPVPPAPVRPTGPPQLIVPTLAGGWPVGVHVPEQAPPPSARKPPAAPAKPAAKAPSPPPAPRPAPPAAPPASRAGSPADPALTPWSTGLHLSDGWPVMQAPQPSAPRVEPSPPPPAQPSSAKSATRAAWPPTQPPAEEPATQAGGPKVVVKVETRRDEAKDWTITWPVVAVEFEGRLRHPALFKLRPSLVRSRDGDTLVLWVSSRSRGGFTNLAEATLTVYTRGAETDLRPWEHKESHAAPLARRMLYREYVGYPLPPGILSELAHAKRLRLCFETGRDTMEMDAAATARLQSCCRDFVRALDDTARTVPPHGPRPGAQR